MEDEKKSIWKKIIACIVGIVSGIFIIRRTNVSGISNGTESVREKLDQAGDGIEQSKGTVNELKQSIDESTKILNRLNESVDRSTGIVKDSQSIIDQIRKRHED